MAEVFVGISQAQGYVGKGERSNPCLAVDLAMLEVGAMDGVHEALVQAGVSTPDGVSTIPDDGADVRVNGRVAIIGGPNMWWSAEEVIADAKAQFEQGQGVIAAVKLDEDPADDAMHLIVLAGQFQGGEGGDILVGDSLFDDMQRETVANLTERLQKTADWAGALFSYHVEVSEVN